MRRKLILLSVSFVVFLITLLSGPPSFDATDGAEFAVCGANLQIAHAPGYPLFLLLLRIFSLIFSPLYGHLRLLNCALGFLAVIVGTTAFRKSGIGFASSLAGIILFITAAPVMSQFNSLEVYPLAILLVLTAMALKETKLSSYAAGMALFGGHPVSILSFPLFFSIKKKWPVLLTFLIPASLFLYVPLRAGVSRIAHYGHPESLNTLINYFTMYSDRLNVPSVERLFQALSFIGLPGSIVFVLLAAAAGKFSLKKDSPIILALLFLASYNLPDPAGQLWILLLPLSLRCAYGIQLLFKKNYIVKILTIIIIIIAVFSGLKASDRTEDDITMRWTIDVLNSLPINSIYRPVAHDAFYAAYAVNTLKLRQDLILSDPFGNYFEFSPAGPIPPQIGERTVHVSRGWNREDSFSLHGLIFSPKTNDESHIHWNRMAIFTYQGNSPDPMAMDLVAEAWIRRMIQETNPILKDSFYLKAVEFSGTPITRSRIENIRETF